MLRFCLDNKIDTCYNLSYSPLHKKTDFSFFVCFNIYVRRQNESSNRCKVVGNVSLFLIIILITSVSVVFPLSLVEKETMWRMHKDETVTMFTPLQLSDLFWRKMDNTTDSKDCSGGGFGTSVLIPIVWEPNGRMTMISCCDYGFVTIYGILQTIGSLFKKDQWLLLQLRSTWV